jgi:phage-related minor tail protein
MKFDISDSVRPINENFEAVNKAHDEKRKREIELTEASKETALVVTEFKELVKEFIETSEKQTKATNKLNTLVFWFTIISVIATVISTVAAVIQVIK